MCDYLEKVPKVGMVPTKQYVRGMFLVAYDTGCAGLCCADKQTMCYLSRWAQVCHLLSVLTTGLLTAAICVNVAKLIHI